MQIQEQKLEIHYFIFQEQYVEYKSKELQEAITNLSAGGRIFNAIIVFLVLKGLTCEEGADLNRFALLES